MAYVGLVSALTCACWGDLPDEIVCEGQYPGHLQGLAGNGVDTLYWSFTTVLVKTDIEGQVLAKAEVPYHHGDLCLVKDRLYVAWSDTFNKPGADSHVYIYDADDLSLLDTVAVPEVTFGAGGMDHHKGHFFIIGGLPEGYEENYVYEYTADFEHVQTHTIPSGYTNLGIQTACCHDGFWWFGCYTVEGEKGLLKTDLEMNLVGIYDISPSIGLVGWGEGHLLMARHFGEKWQAKAVPVVPDDDLGLVPYSGE
ncbi:MAG: hypothetical protein ACP5KN_14220 [Armatimonadota bacterium]